MLISDAYLIVIDEAVSKCKFQISIFDRLLLESGIDFIAVLVQAVLLRAQDYRGQWHWPTVLHFGVLTVLLICVELNLHWLILIAKMPATATVYCILYTVYCILYTVYCILYTVYWYWYWHFSWQKWKRISQCK